MSNSERIEAYGLPQSPLMNRLWAKVQIGAPGECWPFTGYLLKGYGRIGLGGREAGTGYTNRVVAEACYGPAPTSDHQARHLCGNRACCNPSHIAWGTQSENEADKLAHGRSNRGERHGMRRLTVDEVRAVRNRCSSGETQRSVARALGISQQTVSDVVSQRTWGWLS